MLPAIFTLLCLTRSFESGLSAVTSPTSITVNVSDIAFFPCEDLNKGQPLWVINDLEYFSTELIPDHSTNISGLLVYARRQYNNSVYQCRFVDVSVDENQFVDTNITTSLPAMLTVVELFKVEKGNYTCKRTNTREVTYNATSEVVTVSLGQNLTEDSIVNVTSCNNGTVKEILGQPSSTIDIKLTSQLGNEVIIISFPPVCTGSPPHSYYRLFFIHVAINFNKPGTVPSSAVQQLDFADSCLQSSLYGNGVNPASNIQISISANGKGDYISFTNESFFKHPKVSSGLRICFKSSARQEIFKVVGDVKEVLIQELEAICPSLICADSEYSGNMIHIYGSRGILPLVPNGQAPSTMSSTMSDATPSNPTSQQSTITFQPSTSATPSPTSSSSPPPLNPNVLLIGVTLAVLAVMAIVRD